MAGRLALCRRVFSVSPLARASTTSQRSYGTPATVKGLEARLADGEKVLCAEGYLLALARMGYIAHGVWVPEFILEQPEVLRNVHYEFIHAGTDVTEAFQYYTHREKMKQIGREGDLEPINRIALKIAREVATDTGTLMAGGISNTNLYRPDKEVAKIIRDMFEEQVRWSKEEGADYIIGETFSSLGEAEIALEVIKSFDLPAVITMTILKPEADGVLRTLDGVPVGEAFKTLIDKGATVTGPNCSRGLNETLEVVKEAVKFVDANRLCALPIAYRTSKEEPTFFDLTDSCCPENNPVYPHGMDAFYVSQAEITSFTNECMKLGLQYLGVCCGNTGNYTRAMAIAMGKTPPSSRYHDPDSPGMDPSKVKKRLGWED